MNTNQISFQAAIIEDPEMTKDQKSYWLSQPLQSVELGAGKCIHCGVEIAECDAIEVEYPGSCARRAEALETLAA